MEISNSKTGFYFSLAMRKEIYHFLLELRNSGSINMFGASPYIRAKFNLDKYQSRELLNRFMNGSLYSETDYK